MMKHLKPLCIKRIKKPWKTILLTKLIMDTYLNCSWNFKLPFEYKKNKKNLLTCMSFFTKEFLYAVNWSYLSG